MARAAQLGMRPGKCGIMKGRSYLTNLISFYDKMTCQWMRESLWVYLFQPRFFYASMILQAYLEKLLSELV